MSDDVRREGIDIGEPSGKQLIGAVLAEPGVMIAWQAFHAGYVRGRLPFDTGDRAHMDADAMANFTHWIDNG